MIIILVGFFTHGFSQKVARRLIVVANSFVCYYFSIINNDNIIVNASSPSSIIFIKRLAGDVNGDNVIDVEDVNDTINMILKISEVNQIADMDGNGIIDVADVNAIINIILKL